jgi:hypothetical protein
MFMLDINALSDMMNAASVPGGDTWISGQLAGLDRASWGSVRTVPSIGRLQSAPQDAGGPPKAVYDRMVHSCSHPTPRHSIPLQ